VGVEAVDAQRHGALRPVELAQRIDDVDARALLVVGGDGVLEVEHHDVGAGVRRTLEHADVAAGDGEFGAVKAWRVLTGHVTSRLPRGLHNKRG